MKDLDRASVPRWEARWADERADMSYRVHRLDFNMEKDGSKLEGFLNGLTGDVVAIIPNIRKTTLAQIYGMTRKIDFLLIVERT